MVGYVISGVLAVVAAVLAVRLLCQKKRLEKLAEQMEDCLAGRGKPLSFSLREDALAPVENAAAEMENRIEVEKERYQLEARRTSDLTADISHQLKTPLASLRLFVEMDESAHMEQEISQIERMETLIGSLLRLEKLCADGYEFTFAEHAVRPLIENVWNRLRPLWPEKQLTLTGDATIRCDEKWLSEAFLNLLKNACEHTAADGKITVRIEQTDRAFFCAMEDDGGGVPEKDLPHLFERFYRAEGQKQNGAGLGLAIVKEIIYRHHGHISAENTKEGLKFSISIPILNLTKS
ncbi:MAG: HAMP domain-containing histidine kinase [Clostridia bacterium]|nr:HAMP domain-containing histidine kinase [Clostridia bacterium]